MRNVVLVFHKVTDAAWFEMVIKYLKLKYDLVDLDALENKLVSKKLGKNVCHVTVDDGDESFYKIIYPILLKHMVPATLFVSPKISVKKENFWYQEVKNYDRRTMVHCIAEELKLDFDVLEKYDFHNILKCLKISEILKIIESYRNKTGENKRPFQNMTIEQIIEVDRKGLVKIGAHTLNHPILKNEDYETSYDELAYSVNMLKDILGHEIKSVAYPNGIPQVDFSEREYQILKKIGVQLGFSGEVRHLSDTDDMMCLPRIGLSIGSPNKIRLKMLLGEYWESAKNMRNFNEVAQRKAIKNIIKNKSVTTS